MAQSVNVAVALLVDDGGTLRQVRVEDLQNVITAEGITLSVQGKPSKIAGRGIGGGDGAGDVIGPYDMTLPDGTVLSITETYNSDGSLHSLDY